MATTSSRIPRMLNGRLDKIAILAVIIIVIVAWRAFSDENPHLPTFKLQTQNAIHNETLGFQKIYVLALPGREDRVKPLVDAANATTMALTKLSAVRDDQISREDWPIDWIETDHALGVLGCLMSHVRTWHLMIAQGISSALILESDADWDLRIRESLQGVAEGVRKLTDWPFDQPHNTRGSQAEPYGDNWDIIWFGHCGCIGVNGNARQYHWNDSSTTPPDKQFNVGAFFQEKQHPPGTRSVFGVQGAVCSTGYAVSLRGAQKFSKHLQTGNSPVDLRLSDVCRDEPDVMCMGVYPSIITNAASASNIDHPDASNLEEWVDFMKKEGSKAISRVAGHGIQYSARVNAPTVLANKTGQEGWKYEYDGHWIEKNHTRVWEPFPTKEEEVLLAG